MPASSPFLQYIAEEMHTRRYAKRTIETYLYWIKFFILFHKKQHPKDLSNEHVEQFLTHLTVTRHVAVQTQALALNALSFLYKEILKRPLALNLNFNQSTKARKLPVVLTQTEVKRLLATIDPQYLLLTQLLYGSGLRLMEAIRLRVNAIDFDYLSLMVWHGKGGKHFRGMDIRTVQEQLGHSDVKTTQIYTHVLKQGGNAVKSPLSQLTL